MKVAVVGATGLVGRKMLQVLEERNFPVTELIPVASERSVGKEITFKGKNYKVMGMRDAINMKPQLAIFSAGGDTSLEWAPIRRSRNYRGRQLVSLENGPDEKIGDPRNQRKHLNQRR